MRAAPPPAQAAAPRNDRRDNARGNDFRRGPDRGGPAPNQAMRGGPPAQGNAMMRRGPDNGGRRDFSALHRNFTSPHRFHVGIYHRPPGFYARRWVYGDILPRIFWARDYWLSDFYDYDLPPPPPGTVWVRYWNDALLIDEYNGEVIEVAYNVFY